MKYYWFSPRSKIEMGDAAVRKSSEQQGKKPVGLPPPQPPH